MTLENVLLTFCFRLGALTSGETQCLNCSGRLVGAKAFRAHRLGTGKSEGSISPLASNSNIFCSTLTTSTMFVDAGFLTPFGVSLIRLNTVYGCCICAFLSPASLGLWRGFRRHRFTSSLARLYQGSKLSNVYRCYQVSNPNGDKRAFIIHHAICM